MSVKKTEVTATNPNFALKEKLGPDVDIREALSSDVIAEAEKVIEQSKSDFFGDAATDLVTMEQAYEASVEAPDASKPQVQSIMRLAFSLKGQSETLGFDLLALACKSLSDFCTKHYRAGNAEQLIVIRKHLDTIRVIVKGKMQGDGGKIGSELISSLHLLTKKYE